MDSAGKVGIGTTSPQARLQVATGLGTVPTLSSGTALLVQNNANASDVARLVMLSGDSGTSAIQFATSSQQSQGSLSWDNATFKFAFSGGNVGIGATGPAYPLEINPADVAGASDGTGLLGLVGKHDTVNRPYVYLKNKTAGTTTTGGIRWLDGNGTEKWALESNRLVGSGTLEFNLGGVNKVTLDAAGKVGIGTGSPSSQLHVQAAASTNGIVIVDAPIGYAAYTRYDSNGTAKAHVGLIRIGGRVDYAA